jgi:hypothetical protein
MTCSFCEVSGHNIRNCTNIAVGYTLMQVRCKHWKSINQADLTVLWRWLHRQPVPTLRVILIHKYNTFPKTMSKIKLIAIIMDLEFDDVVDGAFWRVHLPTGFVRTGSDSNNRQETDILFINIAEYQLITNDQYLMSNAELVSVLMPLYIVARNARRANRLLFQVRKRITYVAPPIKAECEDELFECSICYEDVGGPKTVSLGCNHKFCCECIEMHIRGKETAARCPLCRGEIDTVSMCADGNESLMSVL